MDYTFYFFLDSLLELLIPLKNLARFPYFYGTITSVVELLAVLSNSIMLSLSSKTLFFILSTYPTYSHIKVLSGISSKALTTKP